ncbi:MAG: hypothetical protein ACOYJY_04770 [Acutalibacteraceae bacterium]
MKEGKFFSGETANRRKPGGFQGFVAMPEGNFSFQNRFVLVAGQPSPVKIKKGDR